MDLELKLTILTKKSRIMKVGEDIKKKLASFTLPLLPSTERVKKQKNEILESLRRHTPCSKEAYFWTKFTPHN